MFYVFLAKITGKYGVMCKTNCNLWFYAKDSPTTGVMCYFLFGAPHHLISRHPSSTAAHCSDAEIPPLSSVRIVPIIS
jgi:hypothetical protein